MKSSLKLVLLLVLPALGACTQTASDGSALSSPGSQVALYAAGVAAGFDPTGLATRAIAVPYHAASMEKARRQLAEQEERLRVIQEIRKEFAESEAHAARSSAAKAAAE